MTKGIFDWKTMTLVGLALVAGLLGARSMISGVEGRGDQGFGESTVTPLTSDEPTVEPLEWSPPTDPRNPFEMTEGFETPTVIVGDLDSADLDSADPDSTDLDSDDLDSADLDSSDPDAQDPDAETNEP